MLLSGLSFTPDTDPTGTPAMRTFWPGFNRDTSVKVAW